MQKVTDKLEQFFWLFLFINPFLDIGNGLFIMMMEGLYDKTWEQINLAITPSLLVRMVVLVLFALYLLLSWDKRALRSILPIGAVWVLSVAGEFIWPMQRFSLFTDLQYIARFGYNLVVLFIYWRVFQHMKLDRAQLLERLNGVIVFFRWPPCPLPFCCPMSPIWAIPPMPTGSACGAPAASSTRAMTSPLF